MLFRSPRAIEAKVREALQRTLSEGAEDESGIRIEPSPDGGQQGSGQAERRPARPPVKRTEARAPVQQAVDRPAQSAQPARSAQPTQPAPQPAKQPYKKPYEPAAKPEARKQLGVAAGSAPRADRKPPRAGRPGQKPPFKSGGPKPFKPGGPKQTGAHRKGPRPR